MKLQHRIKHIPFCAYSQSVSTRPPKSPRCLHNNKLQQTRQHAPYSSSSTQRPSSEEEDLRHTLQTRIIPPVFDDLVPDPSARLTTTLSSVLSSTSSSNSNNSSSNHHHHILPPSSPNLVLPPGHELVYLEPTTPPALLQEDGTNPDQSPGEPFTRRMWAGGRVQYAVADQDDRVGKFGGEPLRLDGSRAVCAEFLRDVTVKGMNSAASGSEQQQQQQQQERIFVEVERRKAKASQEECDLLGRISAATVGTWGGFGVAKDAEIQEMQTHLSHLVRQRLWRDSSEDMGESAIVETRNLVFMRPLQHNQKAASSASATNTTASTPTPTPPTKSSSRRFLKPPHATSEATWTHTLTTNPALLFRFSALTFNAHAIHLDPTFSREIEGHERGRLVHGPLTYVVMMELLRRNSSSSSSLSSGEQGLFPVRRVEYRNLAPLYCGEEITFCGRRTGEGKWDVWVLNEEGGLAVKGSVWTMRR